MSKTSSMGMIVLLTLVSACAERVPSDSSSTAVLVRELKLTQVGDCSAMTSLYQPEGSICHTSDGFEFTRIQDESIDQKGWRDNTSGLLWLDGMSEDALSFHDNLAFCQKRGARIPTRSEVRDLASRNFNEVFGFRMDWHAGRKNGFWAASYLWTSTQNANDTVSNWVFTTPEASQRGFDFDEVVSATMQTVSGPDFSAAGAPNTPLEFSSVKAICVK